LISNVLRSRVQIVEKSSTMGALGQTVVWAHSAYRFARIIPLDVRAVAHYQQLDTQSSHKIIFRGEVDIQIGQHKIVHKGTTYIPQQSAKHLGDATEVIVLEEQA